MFIPIRFVAVSATSLNFFRYDNSKTIHLYSEQFRDYESDGLIFKINESHLILDKDASTVLILDLRSNSLPFKKIELSSTISYYSPRKYYWLRDDAYCFSITDRLYDETIESSIVDLSRLEIITREKIIERHGDVKVCGILHSRHLNRTSLKKYNPLVYLELSLYFNDGNNQIHLQDKITKSKVLSDVTINLLIDTKIISHASSSLFNQNNQNILLYTVSLFGKTQCYVCTLIGETLHKKMITILDNYYIPLNDDSILAIDESGGLIIWHHLSDGNGNGIIERINFPTLLKSETLKHIICVGYDRKEGAKKLASILSQIPIMILELILIPYCEETF
jgi:hypothetical protein